MNTEATTTSGGPAASSRKREGWAAGLVWVLVGLSVLGAWVTLRAMDGVLAGVRGERASASAARDATDALISATGRAYATARERIETLLAGRTLSDVDHDGAKASWSQSLARVTDAFAEAGGGAKAQVAVEQVTSLRRKLESLELRCRAWRDRAEANQTALAERKRKADASLGDVRAAVDSAEGAYRLGLALKVRQFRREAAGRTGGDSGVARDVVDKLKPAGGFSDLSVEISDLAVLVERLPGEEQIDRLSDLKDNQIAAARDRARTLIRRCADAAPEQCAGAERGLTAFETAVLGTGFQCDADHQTIHPGPDGLYALTRDRLLARQEREGLRSELESAAGQYTLACDRLGAFSDGLKDRIAAAAEERLADAGRRLGILSASAAALVLVLGYLISSAIRRQIRAVREATERVERSNAEMAAIHATALDAVFVLDAEWRVRVLNPAAERQFGLTAAAVGTPIGQWIAPGSPTPADANGQPAQDPSITPAGRRFESVALRPDGTRFPVELAVTSGGSGGTPFHVVSARDLSDRKRAEAEHEQLQARLRAASRQAGMAEVATGVLHNVGNVLNSVNVSASVIGERLRKSEVASLKKAGGLLDEHLGDLPDYLTRDERGRHLPRFLIEVARTLADDQDLLVGEFDAVARGLEHIKYVIAAQQSHAKSGVVLEPVAPDDVAAAAVTMLRESFERHGIAVELSGCGAAPVRLDRQMVLQVLINLLSNAKNAVCEGRETRRSIRLRTRYVPAGENTAAVVRFIVEDNGVGIAPENLARVFAHGFTTRKEGHGFGLHSAANAAREMGGALRASSSGPGRGAAFELEIPALTEGDGADGPAPADSARLQVQSV